MSDDYFAAGCTGSAWCPNCGGACSTDAPEPYTLGLHQRRLLQEAEEMRGEPEPEPSTQEGAP